MKRIMQIALIFAMLLPALASAANWRVSLNETGYTIRDAVGFLQNASGDFQGGGFGSGLIYGPYARLKYKDFEAGQILNIHLAGASRVGDTGREGSKMSGVIGVSPFSIMGVHATVDYNFVDRAATWGLQIIASDVFSRLTK